MNNKKSEKLTVLLLLQVFYHLA